MGDGMPLSTLGINAMDVLSLRLAAHWSIARLFALLKITRLAAWRAHRVYRRSAAFGLFLMSTPDPLSFVRVGILWQRVWLMLTKEGWTLQPVMGLTLMGLLCREQGGEGLSDKQKERFIRENLEIRGCLSIGDGETVGCIFRLGRSERPVLSRAPRRPLDELLKNRIEEHP